MTDYKVVITKQFEMQLKEILTNVQQRTENVDVVTNLYEKIMSLVIALSYYPKRFSQYPYHKDNNRDIRKISRYSFVVLYEVDDEKQLVNVLAIFYQKQNPPVYLHDVVVDSY